jgi:hypothetical protein
MEGDFDFESASLELSDSLFGPSEVEETPGDDVDILVDETDLQDAEAKAGIAEEGKESTETDKDTEALDAEKDKEGSPPSTDNAPKTWRKEAAAEWAKLPPGVQQEIHKREQDMYKGLETYRVDASIGNNFKDCVTPHLEHLQKAGVDPYEEIGGLLEYGKIMRFGNAQEKMALISSICAEYGIDPLDLAEHQPAYVDPAIKALQDKIKTLESTRTNETKLTEQTARQNAQRQIDEFAADPSHEYFHDVQDEMKLYLQSGMCKNLQEAYDKAVKSNPIAIAKEQARLTSEALAKSQKKVDAAKKATATNLKTNARPGSVTAPLGSMDDTLKATLNDINSRS